MTAYITGLLLAGLALVLGRVVLGVSAVVERCTFCGRPVTVCSGYCPESGREVRR